MATVLVVDDSRVEREMMGQIVKSLGHNAEFAADGDEGLTKAQTIKPDLILLDVVMPKQNGFDTCRKLKKDTATSKIPVVLVSSKGTESDKFWGQRQGCDGYVVKPFERDQLAGFIQSYVSKP